MDNGGRLDVRKYTLPSCSASLSGCPRSTVLNHLTHMRPSCKEKKSKASPQELPPANHPPACSLHTCASSYRVPWEGWGPAGCGSTGATSDTVPFLPVAFLRLRMTSYFFGRGGSAEVLFLGRTIKDGSRRASRKVASAVARWAPPLHLFELP